MYTSKYTTQSRSNKSKNSAKFLRHNTDIGNYGEKFIKQLLIDSGYLTKKRRKKRLAGDLWTLSIQTRQTRNIEVKTAIESQSGTYKFSLVKEGHTDYCHSDYIILLLIDKYNQHYVYCIPCSVVTTRNITVTSHPLRYAGKYAKYRVYGQVNFDEIEVLAWMR